MSDFLDDFGKILKRKRSKNSWSQKQAAEKIGVTQASFSGYESGVLPRKREDIEKLVNTFGITLAVYENDHIDSVLHAAGYEVKWERNHLVASKDGHRWVCYPDD